MDEAGIDVLVATSKHNVQYLLGGQRAIFFDYMDAIGRQPLSACPGLSQGRACEGRLCRPSPGEAQREVEPFWMPEVQYNSIGLGRCHQRGDRYHQEVGRARQAIGVEMAFLPMDAGRALPIACPTPRSRMRCSCWSGCARCKSPAELAKLRKASELVIESMLAVIGRHGPGTTKREMFEALRREEVNRGLTFEYCLIAGGTSHNRAPSPQRWEQGDVLSLDSGGNYHGYIGDLARMAVLGEPDAELEDLLAEIEAIQQAALQAVKAGVKGGEIYAAAEGVLAQIKQHNNTRIPRATAWASSATRRLA